MRAGGVYPHAGDWAWRWVFLLGTTAILIAMLAGCGTVGERYVEADAATLRAIGPVYLGYTKADPELDEAAKARRERLIRSWQARVTRAQGELE